MKAVSTGNTLFNSTRLLACCALLVVFCWPSTAAGQALTGIRISPSQPTVAIGAEEQLRATASYAGGPTADVTGSVTWYSTEPHTVGISAGGLVSGRATGIATIVASYQGRTATAIVTSWLGDIHWSAPITITRGGTYSGNWKSTVPGVAAVTIATAAPVLLENSWMTGPSDLINDPFPGNRLTVRNVIGVGVNPNVLGLTNGIFVDAQQPASLDVENCYFENVTFGVYVRGYVGNRDGTQTVTILNNRGRNILGVESDGQGGYLPGETHWQWAHTIQLGGVYSVPGIRIAWNELINDPYKSLVNEVINMYESGGTASDPALIHDNYIQGAYAWNPAVDFFNGGGFTTDGNGSDTLEISSSFNHIYGNQIVDTVNVGLEIGAGHDNAAYNNRIISSGVLPNGTRIPSQNVGLTIYDNYGNVSNGTMYNNRVYGNLVGWMCWISQCAWDGYRNDEWFEDSNSDYAENQTVAPNPIPVGLQDNEYTVWLQKLSANAIVVGPRMPSLGAAPGADAVPAIQTDAWYTVTNTNSGLCAEAAADSSDGIRVRQNTCRQSQTDQQWQFQPTAGGYYRVVNRDAWLRTGVNHVWDVSGGPWAVADKSKVQLWTDGGETNQQWLPVWLGNGAWKFVVRNSLKCLDVPNATSDVLASLQQYDCNGGDAQSYTLQPQ